MRKKLEEKRQQREAAAAVMAVHPPPPSAQEKRAGERTPETPRKQWGGEHAKPVLAQQCDATGVVREGIVCACV